VDAYIKRFGRQADVLTPAGKRALLRLLEAIEIKISGPSLPWPRPTACMWGSHEKLRNGRVTRATVEKQVISEKSRSRASASIPRRKWAQSSGIRMLHPRLLNSRDGELRRHPRPRRARPVLTSCTGIKATYWRTRQTARRSSSAQTGLALNHVCKPGKEASGPRRRRGKEVARDRLIKVTDPPMPISEPSPPWVTNGSSDRSASRA